KTLAYIWVRSVYRPQYAKGILKFATGSNFGPHSYFEGDDIAAGATAGIMLTPNPGTRIGLGWRSQITHDLEGVQATGFFPALGPGAALAEAGVASKVELKLPDIVTLSLNQAINPQTRFLATVEWSNWSRLESLDLVTTGGGFSVLRPGGPGVVGAGTQLGSISAKWDDGWFFSGGLEYDVNKSLTVRAGGAYEISPITQARERIASIPDADRIWASVGASYNLNDHMTIDFGYSHVFVDDARIDRDTLAAPTRRLVADLDASVDIISLGMRMKLGAEPAPLK
ncbi:MAG: outer membrane protein transport protein, partial [Hyphomicrobiaceae bacterium]|nr:outer membrane protein transport protein [Hyphomicrobiaceae bacterium]